MARLRALGRGDAWCPHGDKALWATAMSTCRLLDLLLCSPALWALPMRVTPPPLQAWRLKGPGAPERMSFYCPLGERERRTGRRGKGCGGSSLSDSAQVGRVAQSLVSHRAPRAFYKWGEQNARKAPSRRERAVAHRVHPQDPAHVERTLPSSCSKRRPLRFYRRAGRVCLSGQCTPP